MPAGNRTGPNGMGPRTGRGLGYCAGYNMPGYANQGFGGGFGRGFGGGFGRGFGGRGYRNMYYATGQPGWMRYGAYAGGYPPAPMTPEQEQDALKAQETWLQEQLDAVRGQMNKDKKDQD
ncbi:MAG: DUF5320 domain-containing protein [Anaerolineaceae bacterium]|nr:DUF5320 domain-containing protein [Anaerolineaceae bacterium]